MKTKLILATTVVTASLALASNLRADSDSAPAKVTEIAQAAADESVIEKLTLNPQYSILVAALEQTGLDAMFKGDEGNYTVFAPDNAAFRKLPEGTVDELMKDENKDKLTEILKMHVLPSRVVAAEISDSPVANAAGKELVFTTKGDVVMVDGATITVADMEASNGVIHNIDTVLMP